MNDANKTTAPPHGTEDYRRWSVLFNDVTYAPTRDHLLFSERLALTHHLWAQGWRRDVRPDDITNRANAAEVSS